MAARFPLPDAPPRGNTFPPQISPQMSPTAAQAAAEPAIADAHGPAAQQGNSDLATGEQHRPQPPNGKDLPPPPKMTRQHRPPQLTIQTDPTKRASPPAGSGSSSITLVRNDEPAPPPVEETPVMRSMFPRMGSGDGGAPPPPPSLPRSMTSSPLPPPPPRAPHLARTISPSVSSLSLRPSPQEPTRLQTATVARRVSGARVESVGGLSGPEELLDLWTIANGQLSQEAKETYKLDLQCSLDLEREVMRFTSRTASSVYSLRATGSRVDLSRCHPLNPAQELTVSTPTLRSPTGNSPILATISPLLAELLAQDSASTLAVSNGLSRQNHDSLQVQAISRARALESASLLWDSDSASYFFTIPGMMNPQPHLSQTLPIIIRPGVSLTLHDAAHRPLLCLDLDEATLTIHTKNVTALSSSMYVLDLLVSVLMTLLVHLHRHTSLLAPCAQTVVIPHFDPPPTAASTRASSRRASSRASRGSKNQRWLAIRSPKSRQKSGYLQSPAPAALRSPTPSTFSSPYLGSDPKDLEAAISLAEIRPSLSTPIPSIPSKGVAPELRREVTGVDLSRFQAFDLSDPELGAVTRGMLRVLYWAFGVMVWVLGVGVGVLAAGIVAVGGCVARGDSSGKATKTEGRIDGGREG